MEHPTCDPADERPRSLLQRVHARLELGPQDPEIEALKQVTEPRRVVEHIERYVHSPSADGGDDAEASQR